MKTFLISLLLILGFINPALADKRPSEFPQFNESNWSTADIFTMVDVSTSSTKKTTVGDFDTRYYQLGQNLQLTPSTTVLFNNADANYRLGYNIGAFTTAHLSGTSLQLNASGGATHGFAIGTNGTSASLEVDNAGKVWANGDVAVGGNLAVTGNVAVTGTVSGSNINTNSLLPSQTSNATKFLQTDGTNTSWAAAASAPNVVSKTTTYNAVQGDYIYASGASFPITLPTAIGALQPIVVEHAGTSGQVYTLNTTSSQTIGGIAGGSVSLSSKGEVIVIISDGTNWRIYSHTTATVGNHASGMWRIESATISAASPGVPSNMSSPWINGNCPVTGSTIFTCTFTAGTFSGTPNCIVSTAQDSSINVAVLPTTSSSQLVVRAGYLSTTGGVNISAFNVICMGTR